MTTYTETHQLDTDLTPKRPRHNAHLNQTRRHPNRVASHISRNSRTLPTH
jgi:hypothetical protein